MRKGLNISEMMIALSVIAVGVLLSAYGWWRMDQALLITRHVEKVLIGVALVLCGGFYLIRAGVTRWRGDR